MTEALNQDFVELCRDFLQTYYDDEIGKMAQRYPKEQRSLVVDWMDMFQYDVSMADDYLAQPEQVREHLEEVLRTYDLPVDVGFERASVRVTNIEDDRTYDVGGYLPEDIGEAISVRGQVSQVSESKPELVRGAFECIRCGVMTYVPQPSGDDLQLPSECSGCERSGPFQLDRNESMLQDSQVIRIQQPPEQTRDSGGHLDIRLKDDLASADIYGGERVDVSGVLSIDERDLEQKAFDYHLAGDHVTVEDGSYEDINPDEHREEIEAIKQSDDPVAELVNDLAPHLSRDEKLTTVMEALVLQMVGTDRKDPEDGATIRGDSHVLLLGDPGTSKSELLEQVETLSPRAKLKSGEGITQAGVTAAATKDDFGPTQWSVKAGLMVLASGGIACLDEIDKADGSALESMHQALENQRVTISKAGIDADMPSQTSLLAAGNPKFGRFDPYQPVSDQIDLSPALMSRFDLMFMMRDEVDPERDEEIADKIIESWSEAGLMVNTNEDVEGTASRDISEDAFKAYLAEAKQEIHPVIRSQKVKDKLREEYLEIRLKGENADEDSPVPITARKLEAFLRLAECSARARFCEEVELEDVERASRLVHASLEDVGVDPESGKYDTDIVETGTSKSQRERMKRIESIIVNLEEEHEGGAPIEKVLEYAEDMDLSEENVEEEIQKLKDAGRVYEPTKDHLRKS